MGMTGTTLIDLALWGMVLLPAVVGGALALLRLEPIATPIALMVAAITTVLAGVVALTGPEVAVPFVAGAEFAMGVDPLSALMVPTVAVVTLLALVFASGDIENSRGRFNGLMLIFSSAALVTATAKSLPTLLMAWEIMGAMSFALIGFWWRDDKRVSSGVVAFLTTRTADVGLYLAAGAAVAGGAGFLLADLSDSTPGWRHVVAAGILLAAVGKAAQLPFSFWLSRAMDGPSPVSALLHSAAMVAMGGYLLLRAQPLLAATGWAGPTAAWIGVVTALVMGVVAITQRDLKQLLAASTAAQLGFVVMAAGVGSVAGGAAHLVAHASTKALLFLAAGAWLTALGTKQFAALRGVARRWRLVGWSATVGALSLAGVAPLALWATKDAVLASAQAQSLPLYVAGLAAAALSAGYAGKVLVVVWQRVPESERSEVEARLDDEQQGTRYIGMREKVPLFVLAVGAGVLGVLALPPLGSALSGLLGGAPIAATAPELAVSAAIAAVVVVLVWRFGVPEPRWAQQWLGLERLVHATVVHPTLVLAERCARFDDHVLDGAVENLAAVFTRTGTRAAHFVDARLDGAVMTVAASGTGLARQAAAFDDEVLDGAVRATSTGAHRLAERSAEADGHWIDGAVETCAAGMRRLGRIARRPQTGQLHQYYIQAVAVLAVGVLLLLVVR